MSCPSKVLARSSVLKQDVADDVSVGTFSILRHINQSAQSPRTACESSVKFDAVRQGEAEAFWTRSGHVIVQPLIDGRAIGYMILDTGAVPITYHAVLLPCLTAQVSRPRAP